MPRYRLLTFNIAHARGAMPIPQALRSPDKLRANLRKIARLIVRLQADVVALQEVDENCRWSGSFDHLEFLRQHTGLRHSVHGVTNRRYGHFHLSYGNALLSRFPVRFSETVPFGFRTVGEKGFLFAEIELPAGRMPFVNVHMHHRSRAIRLRQVVRLMHYLDYQRTRRRASWRTGPVVCGDLNNPSHEPDATATLLGYLEQFDNYTLLPKGTRPGRAAMTFPAYWPRFALDYVYLPSTCVSPHAGVMRSLLSDHRPVLVEFGLG